MALTFQYTNSQESVTVKAQGEVTINDIKSCLSCFLNSDDFPPNTNSLWDIRELSFNHIDMGFLKQLVELRKEYNAVRGDAKIAIVSNYALAAPIIKLYMILSSGLKQQNKVFNSKDDAKKWLSEGGMVSTDRIGKLN